MACSKEFLLALVVSTFLMINTWSVPLDSENNEEDLYLSGLEVVDDMIFDRISFASSQQAKTWPLGIIFYKISSVFDQEEVNNITLAMRYMESVSCIRFVEANILTVYYVEIVDEREGCNSQIGFVGSGRQTLNLNRNRTKCLLIPTVTHELMHTVGFFHEHCAPDRDDYITVHLENVMVDKQVFFAKRNFSHYGYGYDCGSLMHYGPYGFSANGEYTITKKNCTGELGQRKGLSNADVLKLNAMYKCPKLPDYTLTDMVVSIDDFVSGILNVE